MFRNFNSRQDGSSFSNNVIEDVWQKGIIEPKYNSFRKDSCGASMQQ